MSERLTDEQLRKVADRTLHRTQSIEVEAATEILALRRPRGEAGGGVRKGCILS